MKHHKILQQKLDLKFSTKAEESQEVKLLRE